MVEKYILGKTGLKVTRIAFGGIPVMRLSREEGAGLIREIIGMGINFIDTAFMYGDSEEKIGDAIRDIPRRELVIASKTMARDKDEFLRRLGVSLERLGTDYVDIYQLHNVSSDADMEAVMAKGGALEGLREAMDSGKVRHPGFSSHNLKTAEKMMLTGAFSTVQVPFNFVDSDAADRIVPLARELNMGFIAMKPLGGGLLDDAGLCFRYLMQYEGIVPDPGVENADEMRQILEIVRDPRPLHDTEKKRIEEIREKMGSSWCHRCDYCQPCPQGIPISLILVTESVVKRMSYDTTVAFMTPPMEKAATCTECGQCAERCPYDLKIPDLIKGYLSAWERYVNTREWVS